MPEAGTKRVSSTARKQWANVRRNFRRHIDPELYLALKSVAKKNHFSFGELIENFLRNRRADAAY